MAQNPRSFRFHEVDLTSVKKEIGKLNNKKAITFGNIPIRDLKRAKELTAPIISGVPAQTSRV